MIDKGQMTYHSEAERKALQRQALLADLTHAAATDQTLPPTMALRAAEAIELEV